MGRSLIWIDIFIMLAVFQLLITGIRKLNGSVFFQESNQAVIISAIIAVFFEIKKLDFSFRFNQEQDIGWILLYSIPIWIIIGGTLFRLRKKVVTIYGISRESLIRIVNVVFSRYRMVLEKDEIEELLYHVKDMGSSVRISEGAFGGNKWTLNFNKYRKIMDFELIMEDLQKGIYEKSDKRKRYRGVFDILFGIGIFAGLIWFNYKFPSI